MGEIGRNRRSQEGKGNEEGEKNGREQGKGEERKKKNGRERRKFESLFVCFLMILFITKPKIMAIRIYVRKITMRIIISAVTTIS